jgi:hypothetical protein
MAESLVHDVNWNIDYKFHLGKAWSRFLVSLRDDKVNSLRHLRAHLRTAAGVLRDVL